jgi:hypothetical protein
VTNEVIVWKGLAARRDRIELMALRRNEGVLEFVVKLVGGQDLTLVEESERETVNLYVHGVKGVNGLTKEEAQELRELMLTEFSVPRA